MKHKLSWIAALLLSIFVITSVGAETLYSPPQVYPGEVLSVYLLDSEEDVDVSVTLYKPDGTVYAHVEAVPFFTDELEGKQHLALIGLDSLIKAGTYTIHVESQKNSGLSEYERPIIVRTKSFLSETIPLDVEMTTLRSEENPQKLAQSRHLWTVLKRVSDGVITPSEIMITPVDEYIESSWYGDRRIYSYSDGEEAQSVHNGLDLAAPTGTVVVAPLEGKVVMAEERIITGNTIIIEHFPGVYTLYYHLDRLDVKLDQSVKQGDRIGTVGSTGLVTGPHLHWELRVNGNPVDPKPFLSHSLIDKSQIITMIDETKEQGR